MTVEGDAMEEGFRNPNKDERGRKGDKKLMGDAGKAIKRIFYFIF